MHEMKTIPITPGRALILLTLMQHSRCCLSDYLLLLFRHTIEMKSSSESSRKVLHVADLALNFPVGITPSSLDAA